MRFEKCPVSREKLDDKVFPVKFLKGKLTDWLVGRFSNAIYIAKQFRFHKDKFDIACKLAEEILADLGEEVYFGEANKLSELLLESPYLESPMDFAIAYKRVYKTLSPRLKNLFLKREIREFKV